MMVANATMLSSITQLTSHVKCARKGKRALREHWLVANAIMLSLMSQPISHFKERLKEQFLPDGAEYQPA
ncbi:Protein CBG26618 [Caenorhabditis briggsae]|uniref:Protein CBG26618 n=1 Tax=Caenorhabditis briggsae TaxID=6238 RepID=B6IL98_CAEBR|nr:Protein CBG26618 [Caenorhabditis briggsae]CAS00678.1 Protein CBG26618 [Caenorhabditis briggsae]